MKVMGIDIGGTSIKYNFYTNKNFKTKNYYTVKTPTNGKEILDLLKDIIEKEKPDLIGISSAGSINFKTGEVLLSTNIRNYQGTNLKKEIENTCNIPVFIDNDVNCAAYCEYKLGSLKGSSSAIMLTIGTGIGSGLIINNEIYRGENFAAGEIGHQIINNCSFEKQASSFNVLQTIKSKNINSLEELLSLDTTEKKEIMSSWYDIIANGLGNVMAILDISTCCIGGGVVDNVNFRTEELLKRLNSFSTLPITMKNKIKINKATFQNEAGTIGAALIAINNIERKNK